ncbi:MAG: PPC domain-containing protein, partial [Planctomycetaceae bacterium]|nr:PPC domain-containing protein [Planctomycetaceae bacterium]
MIAIRQILLFLVPFTLLGTQGLYAQNDPHLAYLYPAGLMQGATREVVIGGQHLQNVDDVHIEGTGIQVEILGWYRPMTRGVFNNLRMRLNETEEMLRERGEHPTADDIAEAAGVTADQLREMEIFREREADPRRQPNEQLEEELTIRLTVSRTATPGKREFRLLTETAMSNPFWLHVGTLYEHDETEPNHDNPEKIEAPLPILVNGQIMPGDEDRFSFYASKGTRLVINAGARDVIPYLADAVPGWFQAILLLSDSNGKTVAHADSFYFSQDPAILYEVPQDDWYTVSIRDSLYRGREDFVYRMTIGELPILTSVFPLGFQAGAETTVQFDGWNLDVTSVDLKTPLRRFNPTYWVSLPQQVGPPLRFPLQVGTLAESVEQEPNDDFSTRSIVTRRETINGRIDHPGDHDVFRLETAGRLIIEVEARRHGSPLDSMLTLVDEHGVVVDSNDDYVDKSLSLLTHHADSHLEAAVSKTKPLYLILTDAQGKGGADFVYRLHIRSPEPDFELRVVPATIIASAGATVPITAFALRRDGFRGAIQVALDDPPDGFELHGGSIPADAESMQMTLRIPDTHLGGRIPLSMSGTGHTPRGGSTMKRPALPAENMMQAFIWYHLVPVDEWNIIVNERRTARQPPLELAESKDPIAIVGGHERFIPARLTASNVSASELRVELLSPPPGISAEIVTDGGGHSALKIVAESGTAPESWQGNLLMRLSQEKVREPTPTDLNPAPQ